MSVISDMLSQDIVVLRRESYDVRSYLLDYYIGMQKETEKLTVDNEDITELKQELEMFDKINSSKKEPLAYFSGKLSLYSIYVDTYKAS